MADTPPVTATYVVTNDNGTVLRTIPNVLAEVRQTGCATATSELLTVADSTVLYPGMGVCCHEVPEGTYLVAIKDATTVVLSAAATGTTTGLVACFKGLVFVPVSKSADRGWWRNTVSGGGSNKFIFSQLVSGSVGAAGSFLSDSGVSLVPTISVAAGPTPPYGAALMTAMATRVSDELLETPTLRTKTENWSFWILVSTGGHLSVVPFDPEHSLHLKSLP